MNPSSTELQATVKERFAKVAQSPDQEKKFPVGPASAKKLGYDPNEIDALPTSVTESFCGVGNPLGLGELRAGQTVLELGSGPGLDSLLAARRVGPSGKVVGVDMCEEMIAKARHNAELLNLNNVEFVNAGIEKLPQPDASVGVVISNGVFNLCPDKPRVLAEAYRVLRPGGRLHGRHPAGRRRHARGSRQERFLVGLNCRCRVGAVAPANARRRRLS